MTQGFLRQLVRLDHERREQRQIDDFVKAFMRLEETLR